MKHTILSSHFCLFQNSLIDLLTSKDSSFITKKIQNAVLQTQRKKGFWTTNPFFSGLRMNFYRLWYLIWIDGCLLHLKHVSLCFNVYHGLKHLRSLKLVSILSTILWKIMIKCKIVMFFKILGSFSQNVHSWGCRILSNQVSNIPDWCF